MRQERSLEAMSICLRVPKGAQTFPRYHPAWTSSSIGQDAIQALSLLGLRAFRAAQQKHVAPALQKRYFPTDIHAPAFCPPFPDIGFTLGQRP